MSSLPDQLPTSGLPIELDFDKDDDASSERMNRAMLYIVGLIRSVLALKPDYQVAIDQLVGIGLERISLVLTPVFSAAQVQSAELRAIYDSWVAGNGLNDLHQQILGEIVAAVAASDAAQATAIAAAKRDIAARSWFLHHR
jgi:hypothetical protein